MRNKDGAKIDNTHLFKGLNILQAGEKYVSHMGQYPVINMTLKAGKRPTFEKRIYTDFMADSNGVSAALLRAGYPVGDG